MAGTYSPDAASEHAGRLPQRIAAQDGFAEAIQALREGRDAVFDGVWGSACALVAVKLFQSIAGDLVVVFPRPDDVDVFCDDTAVFSDVAPERFPAWESFSAERKLHDEIHGDRLRTLKRLLADAAAVSPCDARRAPRRLVAASIASLLQPTPARDGLAANTRRLAVGDRVDVEQLLRWLVARGFQATSGVELPGEFSRRGGIVDLFAPDWQHPVRIEFFDDQLESMRRFDVSSQRSLEALDAVALTALEPRSADRGHLADYLPDASVFLLVEPDQIQEQARRYLAHVEQAEDFHTLAAVMRRVGRFAVASACAIAPAPAGVVCRLPIESIERLRGELDAVRSELDRVGAGHEVLVVCPTGAEVERLRELLRTTEAAARGQLHFPRGTLSQGFRLVADRIVVISSGELFRRGPLRRLPRRRLGKVIDSFLELREGDLVVHLAHGIGRYRGLELLQQDGRTEEHLKIEFAGGTRIYVPASKIGLVQKYVGGARSRPSLAKIGGKTWVRQKQAAAAAVTDLAAEMLQMQAERRARPGIAFAAESDWQREFDASFAYEETPDQWTTMEAIQKDMEAPRPMDRLLCGDVGFGKTEIAMRAAFKAVDSGYQVALLAPTTVLVEQHYHTFRQRMAEFPFDIARLSRFCSRRQQDEILQRLAAGRIDIVIGTHRLVSGDVRFHNLGLVIVDEEQRFGVAVKERLKSYRATVDVLTLTATPIPRTLHMSLVGVRDISNLQTPPEDRLAVETRVARFDPKVIRHAVLRELNRGGQIYFVHNRVKDIGLIERALHQIVPEADIRVGHGQMPEAELEQVMVDFVAGRFDLLLATTIVESGLDIPNANTIFIHEADRYGLADLHQLRGRVGRYKHRAYCYLLLEPHKAITPNAARRLKAIEEFSDMGAGFAIAMRDLEIRGAGNLLGTQQSGHLAAVGYELYCELLESAVRRLRQMPPRRSIDVDVALPGQAYLPTEYVPDIRMKIDLYRRLSRITELGQLKEFCDELIDRFGPPPEPARRMIELLALRIDAAFWEIAQIYLEDHYLVFRYTNRRRIERLAQRTGGKLRVVDRQTAYLKIPQDVATPDALCKTTKSVLRSS